MTLATDLKAIAMALALTLPAATGALAEGAETASKVRPEQAPYEFVEEARSVDATQQPGHRMTPEKCLSQSVDQVTIEAAFRRLENIHRVLAEAERVYLKEP